MKKGEKIVSYVKYEHELSHAYREKLAEAKRKSEVREVFMRFVHQLLSKIDPEVENARLEDIVFTPEGYHITGELKEKIAPYMEKSDLEAILDRMYEAAVNRYKKIEKDENVDFFKKEMINK